MKSRNFPASPALNSPDNSHAQRRGAFLSVLATIAAGCVLTGCLSKPDHIQYYFLSAPPPAPTAAVERGHTFMVGLRVSSADYLRARHILVEVGDNELRPSEENIWEESPTAGFSRVLSARFAEKLPNCQFIAQPSASTNQPQLIIEIQLQAMQGRLHPTTVAEVAAELRILDANGHLIERDELRKTVPWTAGANTRNYATLAAAVSKAAADLADEVAKKVEAAHGNH